MSIIAPMPAGVVETQVERILASPHFVDTTRLNRFLRYVVEQSLDGNADRLKGYTIGLEVFDRSVDFDPAIDTIVRVQAGKMRQRLDLYYADQGKNDPVRIRIPKGSYSPVFELALNADEEEPNTAAQAYVDTVKPTGPSIAVLPFDNLSGDPSQEFFADGITEEIISSLTKFRELRVISRYSTFKYKGVSSDIRDIASDLGVGFVLEGSVRKWEDKIRVTMQLIEAANGSHLISENYDRTLSAANIFEIHDDIASLVAAEIAEPHGVLSRYKASSDRWETEHLDAYECRLLATEYWRRPNAEAHAHVRTQLEKAVKLDPQYSSAWAMLAIIYGDEVRYGHNYIPDPLPLDRALAAAKRSVDIDHMNATGYHALFMTHYHRGEFDLYERAAAKAIQFNPNYPDMLADAGFCAGLRGDWNRGTQLVEKAQTLSPNPPGWYHAILAIYHYQHKQYEAALSQASLIGKGASVFGPLILLMTLGQLGREQDAAAMAADIRDVTDLEAKIEAAFCVWQIPKDLRVHMTEGWAMAGMNIQP